MHCSKQQQWLLILYIFELQLWPSHLHPVLTGFMVRVRISFLHNEMYRNFFILTVIITSKILEVLGIIKQTRNLPSGSLNIFEFIWNNSHRSSWIFSRCHPSLHLPSYSIPRTLVFNVTFVRFEVDRWIEKDNKNDYDINVYTDQLEVELFYFNVAMWKTKILFLVFILFNDSF